MLILLLIFAFLKGENFHNASDLKGQPKPGIYEILQPLSDIDDIQKQRGL